ncbi:MAG: hypothetical protein U9P82_01185 [Bacteroidota bacterium]|nr:hypothetical protein [Bacteroidota bacterium]
MKNTITLFLALFVIVNLSYSKVNDSSNSITDIDLGDEKAYPKNLQSGQKKINLSNGFGFPELFYSSIRYQTEQFQIGLYTGTLPVPDTDESIRTFSGIINYHFGGYSKLAYRRPWFLKSGLLCLRVRDFDYEVNYAFVVIARIGRDFNITNMFGISIDFGALITLDGSGTFSSLSLDFFIKI